MRRTVEAVLVVHEHGHPHILMMQIANAFFKLPGDYLAPGETDDEGVKRRLDEKLGPTRHDGMAQETDGGWEVAECIAQWWRPNFETFMVSSALLFLESCFCPCYSIISCADAVRIFVRAATICSPSLCFVPFENSSLISRSLAVPLRSRSYHQTERSQIALRRRHARTKFVSLPLALSKTRSVERHRTEVLSVPKNMKLLAIPLFELYDNAVRYGPQLAALPHLLSRYNWIMAE